MGYRSRESMVIPPNQCIFSGVRHLACHAVEPSANSRSPGA
ncbi:Hypothetical protein I596_3595 [Dokdonella koreensis DS-123]|uniref:Uncharacterized protein n=1 Tax=Dokdonella koreensis DS-123 TaxID=1300342 RepID=A0A160DZG0_9GAMM|nr:Hypothetical protein I596_3595 [Dokdonella koreensis DS-123]